MRYLVVVVGTFLLLTRVASATTATYTDFSNTSGLTLNGDATPLASDGVGDSNVLRLVPTGQFDQFGAVFSTSTLKASTGFSTVFQWRMNDLGGITDASGFTGADGMVFVVQNVSNSAGGVGSGIGYQGISPSIGVKFDTFQNTGNNDPSSNYIGIGINGDLNNADFPGGQTTVATTFDNGTVWTGWIDYNGTTLSVYATDAATTVKPSTPLLTYNADIPKILGTTNAYVGFTAAGGSAYENEYLLNWTYYDFYNPTPTPTPTGVPLPSAAWSGLALLAGLGAAKFMRRGKQLA